MKDLIKQVNDPLREGHYRENPVSEGFERCAKQSCGWTSDYPVADGAKQDNGNSFYNYHQIKKLY